MNERLNKDYPTIIAAPSRIELADQYRKSYGVNFKEVNSQLLAKFWGQATALSDSLVMHKNKNEILAQIDTPQTIVLEVPDLFLDKPLESWQKQSIDSAESSKVAEVSVQMQDRLLSVPIVECYELFINLKDLFDADRATFSATTFYNECGEWGGKERQFLVRQGLGMRLLLMSDLLADQGRTIHFEDGFRPLGVQEGLFRRRLDSVKEQFPHYTKDQMLLEARSKTAITPRLASHKGGAAVDLRLKRGGRVDDIGHEYADGGALVYLKSPFVTWEQWQNRQTLYLASRLCGLSMYIGEDWHISYGDNLSSLDDELNPRPGYTAKYGPVKRIDYTTGQILEVYADNELDNIFEI